MNELLAAGGSYRKALWWTLIALSETERASFLIRFADHNEALGVGPALARGEESNQHLSFAQILNKLG